MNYANGMYVACLTRDNQGETIEIAAQIKSFTDDFAVLFRYDISGNGQLCEKPFNASLENSRHVRLKTMTRVLVEGEIAHIVDQSNRKTKNGLYIYWCLLGKNIKPVAEDKIQAPSSEYEPMTQALFLTKGQDNIDDFLSRYVIEDFLGRMDTITDSYKDAFSKKIKLYKHQMETVQKVLSKAPYRAILADEVGLGKTIETIVIMSYLLAKKVCKKTIIIVPDQLIYQWANEIKNRFCLEVYCFTYSNYSIEGTNASILIVGFNDFLLYYNSIFSCGTWDLMIVDEIHKTLHNERLYPSLLRFSFKVEHKIFLSATPIINRSDEYYNLLKLIYPEKYTNMSMSDFQKIVNIRSKISYRVSNLVGDIQHYFESEEEVQEYIEQLKDIVEEINDYELKDFIRGINEVSLDEKKEKVRVSVLYLQKKYELESKFIRHRRADVLDQTSKRKLEYADSFYLKGKDEMSLERELYSDLTDEIQNAISNETVDSETLMKIVSAFFSSASALKNELFQEGLQAQFSNSSRDVIKLAEIEKHSFTSSKIEKLLNYINKEQPTGKMVIFTDFKETEKIVFNRLRKEFGDESVAVFEGNDAGMKMNYAARTQLATNMFKKKDIRFLVCDRAGAEGKNLQFADYIVHFDLPWSPAVLEQRIGRLDRIGRKHGKPVKNVVFYARDTIEEDLFSLYDQYLDIFNKSLSGIEIIFDDLWEMIKNTVVTKGLQGFSYVLDDIKILKDRCDEALMAEEMYASIDEDEDKKLNNIKHMAAQFDDKEMGNFYSAVMKWHYNSGYGNNEPCLFDNGFVIWADCVDAQKAKRRKYNPKLDEDTIVTLELDKNEEQNTELLNTEHSVVKAVFRSLGKCNDGKTLAISIPGQSVEWTGFLLTLKVRFYKIDYMGKCWTHLNYGLKNDFIECTRITIPYYIKGEQMLLEEIMEIVLKNKRKANILNEQDVIECLDFADYSLCLSEAVAYANDMFTNEMQKRIDFVSLDCILEKLKDEKHVCELLKEDSKSVQDTIEVYSAIKNMLQKYDIIIDNIAFVDIQSGDNTLC